MAKETDNTNRTCHYYVDEAGDGNLFNKRKQVVVNTKGCSKYFILGVLEVTDPEKFNNELKQLRRELLSDPYLSSVPSMQPARQKTAIHFHAKDDCAEVRREVYKLLVKHSLKFFAVIRDKSVITEKVIARNAKTNYRYHPNQLYDRCVSRLFLDRLHKEEGYLIRFSKRGNRNRTKALESALIQAKKNYRLKWSVQATRPIEFTASQPKEHGGLQAVDYFLWALQRFYERNEDRYWNFIAPQVSLVHDIDNTSENENGTYYTKENLLTLEKRKK